LQVSAVILSAAKDPEDLSPPRDRQDLSNHSFRRLLSRSHLLKGTVISTGAVHDLVVSSAAENLLLYGNRLPANTAQFPT
jgi:hypothetical protein